MRFRRPLKVLYALQYAQSMPHGAYSDARAILFQSRALQPPERRQDKHGLRRTAKRPVPTLAAADIAAASATRSAVGRVKFFGGLRVPDRRKIGQCRPVPGIAPDRCGCRPIFL